MLKHTGIIGVSLLTLAMIVIAILNWQGPELSISQHIARALETAIAFGIIGSIATILLAVCLFGYIRPVWRLKWPFTLAASVILACMMVVSCLPTHWPPNNLNDPHQLAAWTLVYALIGFVIITVLSVRRVASLAVRIASAAFLAAASLMILTLIFFNPFYRENMFFMELTYFLVFFIFVLALAYSKPREIEVK